PPTARVCAGKRDPQATGGCRRCCAAGVPEGIYFAETVRSAGGLLDLAVQDYGERMLGLPAEEEGSAVGLRSRSFRGAGVAAGRGDFGGAPAARTERASGDTRVARPNAGETAGRGPAITGVE